MTLPIFAEGTELASAVLNRELHPNVVEFFDRYCISCHGPKKSESDLRLDRSDLRNFGDIAIVQEWTEIVNVLNGHEMPPEKSDQPSPSEVSKVVDWATDSIRQSEYSKRSSKNVLRRLNRDEYRNTIRDLTHVDFDVSHFPLDPLAEGFDNNGSALTISPMHMELYLSAAQKVVDEALIEDFVEGSEPPEKIKWRFETEVGEDDSSRVRFGKFNPIVHGGKNRLDGKFRVLHHSSWDKHPNARDFALPQAGWYKVRVCAGGVIPGRKEVVASATTILQHRLDQQIIENPKGEQWHRQAYDNDLLHFEKDPIYKYGPPRLKLIKDMSGQPTTVSDFDVTGSVASPSVFETRTRFDDRKTGVTVEYAYNIPRTLSNFWLQSSDQFARPMAYLDYIEIEGPDFDAWPPSSHRLVLDDLDSAAIRSGPDEAAKRILSKFMRRAYRRPVTKDELDSKLSMFQKASKDGQTFYDAIKTPLVAVLCSPNFLYLTEPHVEKANTPVPLNDHEIATRLSYFLWSTMPDQNLMRAASQGKLRNASDLAEQVDRMLDDSKADAFVVNFSDQWLGLREVGANPPSMDLYPEYDRHLEKSMIEEGHAFFRTIMKDELSLINFIRSDFVSINERLGRFYGIENVDGDTFRKVNVSEDCGRGGIVTLAAIHTITSNGTRTSPVKRGTWIMKNMLGTDPGLPVANAGDIAPKVPGIDKATVRQRLEIHRSLPQCARCHNKIDPLGFALENFNAAGQWRTKEGFGYQGQVQDNDPVVDASSSLPDGTKIDGVQGLRTALMKKNELFFSCLAKKMFTYALGRELTVTDNAMIQKSVNHLKSTKPTVRQLIHFIVDTDAFKTK